ncbi:hypothetical protein K443DRAFT_671206 [Laccaria amethystina LaAM-08-1]|uniref:mitogen-activated protein kinase kinase n=1 Tax=Laccaria amethystina LaAM-08-1 TaxID=1095629 RepID=A0A0C9Y781_9AGAR|nr:hypothetical protein K443DRAFT_671206 [Laccaria amethystina LaAM-08-1]
MDSRTTIMQRPMGPRSRGPPSSLATSNNQPRDQQRLPVPALTVPHEPARSPKPSLSSLTIPRPPLSKPSFPKIKIEINTGSAPGPLFESYYGGPNGPSLDINTPPEDKTIRPESTATCVPQPNQRSTEPFTDIRELVTELEGRPSQPPVLPDPLAEDDDAVLIPTPPTLSWSDDVLEEQSRLGEGAGGAVHKVKDKRTGKVMARKTITTREAPMKQLLRELSIISSTEHINIVLFHGAFMSPSSSEVKILMEYCEGGSLEAVGKRIKERGAIVGEKIAGRLAEGVLQGLAYLHLKKTIHRDIKPPNILLSREGVVKLSDFGVSGELINSLAGTFTGTSFYMAPERICGNEYTIRSDVWSTGISLLELVQNRFPFPNDLPPIELMMYITNGEPPRLEDEPGVQWSDEMKDFIKETLTVDSLTRPTPKDMLAHPWIISVMKQEVHMARWIRQVWDWPKSSRRSRDESSLSRPNTASADSRGSPDSILR